MSFIKRTTSPKDMCPPTPSTISNFLIFTHSYTLGYYNITVTQNQGFDIVHRFKPSDPEDNYINLIYDNVISFKFYIMFQGDECATTGKKRSVNLRLICPSSPGVLTDYVVETSHCQYNIYSSCSWVCNLPWMKKKERPKRFVVCYDIEEDQQQSTESEL